MRYHNYRTGTYPIVQHATGKNGRAGFWAVRTQEVLRDLAARSFAPSDPELSYQIITWSTSDRATILEQCLDLMNVDYHVLREPAAGWHNIHKPYLALEYLRGLDVPYVIALDAFDVLVTEHPDEIMRRYLEYFPGCRMLFNAAANEWPRESAEYLAESREVENSFGLRNRYLNAGVWVGEREFVISILERLIENVERPDWLRRFRHDEQPVMRYTVFPEFYPDVDLDRQCVIFQHMESGKTDLRPVEVAEE